MEAVHMSKFRILSMFVGNVSWLVLVIFFLAGVTVSGQEATGVGQQRAANTVSAVEEYQIGAGDVLTVTVLDAPEFSGKFRVSDAGIIEIAGVREPIHAEGKTTAELGHFIHQSLIDSKQLRDPKINVYVEEFHGRTITILGAVSKPAVYPLQKRTTVLEALSMAGGALPNAGNFVTVVRGSASAEATNSEAGSVQIIDMSRLSKGEALSTNIQVRNGDVLSVSAAQVVYVVGAVMKPGGFVMSNPSEGVSVVQAVALAEGFTSLAASHHGLIIRNSTSSNGRQEIQVDIARIVTGKGADMILAPNDILYIPQSGGKRTLKVMGEVAMSAVNGLAIYGLGYRIGTRP
jgi:polysaccharide biosynthesis/export protein